jgi:hypothetical protein
MIAGRRLAAVGAIVLTAGGLMVVAFWPRPPDRPAITSVGPMLALEPAVRGAASVSARPRASASPSRRSSAASRPPTRGSSASFALPADALLVGPGHRFARPCQAIAAAKPGDTIGIDAKGNGTYNGDVCGWSTSKLTIAGYNGLAHVDAAGHNWAGKAIWVIAGNDTVIRNVELSGATVPDNNGAGIRQEGANLTVIGCYFHDNQDGILAGDNAASDIVVRDTQFGHNGAGDGYSHNFYINHVRSFTLEGSWSHDANVGHLVKSRALTNYIRYNRITGQTGSDSYEIDLPNGGLSYVVGNVVQQGTATQNPNMLSYGEEGNLNPDSQLFVVNNTFVNNLGHGTAVNVGSAVTARAMIVNNISVGSSNLTSQSGADLRGNCIKSNPKFVDAAGYDYRLGGGSPCIDAGTPPGSGQGRSLTPTQEYEHPTATRARTSRGVIDAGAFESG